MFGLRNSLVITGFGDIFVSQEQKCPAAVSLLNPVLHYLLFRFTSHLAALLKLLFEKKSL